MQYSVISLSDLSCRIHKFNSFKKAVDFAFTLGEIILKYGEMYQGFKIGIYNYKTNEQIFPSKTQMRKILREQFKEDEHAILSLLRPHKDDKPACHGTNISIERHDSIDDDIVMPNGAVYKSILNNLPIWDHTNETLSLENIAKLGLAVHFINNLDSFVYSDLFMTTMIDAAIKIYDLDQEGSNFLKQCYTNGHPKAYE